MRARRVWPRQPRAVACAAPSINELKKLSVDQLTDVEVTLVSRAEERLGGAPAAITVVTNEEIWFESADKAGTTFFFTLPAAPQGVES